MPYRAVIQRAGKRWNLGNHATRAEAQNVCNEARQTLAQTGEVAGQRATKYHIQPLSTVITAAADFREAMRTAREAILRTGERRLLVALVTQAIEDVGPKSTETQRRDALEWIMSAGFEAACDHLFEVDAKEIRDRILTHAGIHIVPSQLRLVMPTGSFFPRKENVG